MDNQKLNIVNEIGEIIGEDIRENIHNKGLLHREIHIWFYTLQREIIFQHREKNKDTYPNLLDAAVGGHVEIEMNYESAALQELKEETGINTTKDKLTFIQMVRSKTYDSTTNKTNNAIRAIYAYRYDGRVENLKIEKGKAVRFEAWPLDKIFNISKEDRKRFIPLILKEEMLNIFRKIQQLI